MLFIITNMAVPGPYLCAVFRCLSVLHKLLVQKFRHDVNSFLMHKSEIVSMQVTSEKIYIEFVLCR